MVAFYDTYSSVEYQQIFDKLKLNKFP